MLTLHNPQGSYTRMNQESLLPSCEQPLGLDVKTVTTAQDVFG